MARVNPSALNVAVPSTALLSVPYLSRSAAELQRVLDGPIGAEILTDLEKHDLIGLCFYDLGARSVYSVDKPVRTIADIKGMKVRAQPGDIASTFWQHFGASPFAMPYSRIADGLRTHALDGATGTWTSFVAGEHYKAVKYFDDIDLKSFREPMEQIYQRLYPDARQQLQLQRIRAAATGS